MAHQMKEANQDIVGNKGVEDENGTTCFKEKYKLKVWTPHHNNLFMCLFVYHRS